MIANALDGSNLTTLDLSRNLIRDEGGVALANILPRASGLKVLELCWNEITDISAAAFKSVCQVLSNVEVINLSCNNISPAQLNKISE